MSTVKTVADSNYIHGEDATAQQVYNQRTVEQDAALLVPHLRPGMRLVDFGCGAGSITCGLARLVAPGEVLGFDMSEGAIERARALAEEAGLDNVRFSVADLNELELPTASFDVAQFSRVLMHLREPQRAMQLAFSSLKPGGMLAACEAYGSGNWTLGPNAESIMLFLRVLQEENNTNRTGPDQLIGGRLVGLFREAGFIRLESKPCYSAVLSDSKAVAALVQAGWSDTFRQILIRHGINAQRCDQLLEEILIWAESEDSVAAFAECAVIGWKP